MQHGYIISNGSSDMAPEDGIINLSFDPNDAASTELIKSLLAQSGPGKRRVDPTKKKRRRKLAKASKKRNRR